MKQKSFRKRLQRLFSQRAQRGKRLHNIKRPKKLRRGATVSRCVNVRSNEIDYSEKEPFVSAEVYPENDAAGSAEFCDEVGFGEHDEQTYFCASKHDFIQELKNQGYEAHLRSQVGGSRDEKNLNCMLAHIAYFLEWSWNYKEHLGIECSDVGLMWFEYLILHPTGVLAQFTSNNLSQQKELSCATIRAYIGDIVQAAKWLVLHSSFPHSVDYGRLMIFVETSLALRKAYTKAAKKQLREKKNLEMLYFNRKLPRGGLPELQQVVKNRLVWALSLTNDQIDRSSFEQYIGLLLASIYCFSANGRIQALGSLTVLDGYNLLRHGHVMSTHFKTASSYGYQPVVIDNTISHPLLQSYLSLLRPAAAKNARNPAEAPTHKQPLWLTFSGEPMSATHLGQHFTTFFHLQSSYHITTNTLRGLVETHATGLLRSGKISDNVRGSITAINGHSSQIVREHYLFEDRSSDVMNSRAMFSSTFGEQPSSDFARSSYTAGTPKTYEPAPTEVDYFDGSGEMETFDLQNIFADEFDDREPRMGTNKPIDRLPPPCEFVVSSFNEDNHFLPPPPCWKDLPWGSEHPDHNKESQRAQWSEREIEYIGQFCTHYSSEHPLSKTIASKCISHIKNDPAAIAIFHKNHIENNKKIRTGIDKWRKTLIL